MKTYVQRLQTPKREDGYSWLYRSTSLSGGRTQVVTTLSVISLAVGIFVWYLIYGNDISPDSPFGSTYALIGTAFLLLAMTMFTLRRHLHRGRRVGGLRAALGWHMCFAAIGLAFLCMHSFGELNLRSGTYVLYGMIAQVISGLIGRLLDRLLPYLMATEADRSLTAEGEDRTEHISQQLGTILQQNKQDIQVFAISNAQPKIASASNALLVPPGELMPETQEQANELAGVRHAMQREQFYRYVTLYWRRFHILLALTTVGLLIWHIVYALQLLLPRLGY